MAEYCGDMPNVRVPLKGEEFCHYTKATELSLMDGRLTAFEDSLCLLLCTVFPSSYEAFLGAFENLQKATVSFVMCARVICPFAWNNLAPTEQIFMKFDI
jgi:hypothetical protein